MCVNGGQATAHRHAGDLILRRLIISDERQITADLEYFIES
jgi:hypothetical protein